MPQPAESVVAEVVRIISSSQQKSITGSRLASVLQVTFPGFSPLDYSVLNLRGFLRSHAPQVIEIGRSGGDHIYGLKGEEPARVQSPVSMRAMAPTPATAAPRLSPEVWKTFVSPNSGYQLYGNPETGELRVTRRNETPFSSPWKQIPSSSPAKHLQIAKDFIGSLEDDRHKSLLTQATNQSHWWLTFFHVANELGIGERWSAFRRRRIVEDFLASIKDLGIPFRQEQDLGIRRESLLPTSTLPSRMSGGDSLLRRLATSAVQKMTDAELRALSLPLGYVVDGMREE